MFEQEFTLTQKMIEAGHRKALDLGWTCTGQHEPQNYGECPDCTTSLDRLVAHVVVAAITAR